MFNTTDFIGGSASDWNIAADWDNGIPGNLDSVFVEATGDDNLDNLTLINLYLGGYRTGVLGNLTVNNVDWGSSTSSELEVSGKGASGMVSLLVVNDSNGPVTYEADYSNALLTDESSSDVGAFSVTEGGTAVVWSKAAGSTFDFLDNRGSLGNGIPGNSGTIALAGLSAGPVFSAIENLAAGDTLELQGSQSGPVNATFSLTGMTITTSAGAFTFSDVSYGRGVIDGYSVGYDQSNNLVTVTMTSTADVFTPDTADGTSGNNWSDANSWSQGVPTGMAVQVNGRGVDDLSNLSLSTLYVEGYQTDVEGNLTVSDVDWGDSSNSKLDVGGKGAGTLTILADSDGAVNLEAASANALVKDQSSTDYGTFTVLNNGEIVVASQQSTGSTFEFVPVDRFGGYVGTGGTIALAGVSATTITSAIEDVTDGDTIEVKGAPPSEGNPVTATFGSDSMTITTSAGTYTFRDVSFLNGDVPINYTVGYDTTTGLDSITIDAPCYVRGTRISTMRGSILVEQLAEGDQVMTASGSVRPIRWLGHRRLQCAAHPNPTAVWPVRILAGAFSDELPCRDLWVSPGHSIAIEGCLIQACHLVNGVTIEQVECDSIEYWHVELDEHDIILAEDLPAESYLDTGNRKGFSNGGAFIEAFPDFLPRHWAQTCLPLVLEGEQIIRAKAALFERARLLGYAVSDDACIHLMVDGTRIYPTQLDAKRFAFCIPASSQRLELRSRTFTPRHVEPASFDSRRLGVCVNRLQIDGTDVSLDDPVVFASGWHAPETQPDGHRFRWSQDRMPLPQGTRLVVVDLEDTGYYWDKPAARVVAIA